MIKYKFGVILSCLVMWTMVPGKAATETGHPMKKVNTATHIELLSPTSIDSNLNAIFEKPIAAKFERTEWQNPASRRRWMMLYDLVHSHRLIGMNSAQISDIMGPSSNDSYTRAFACDANVQAYEPTDGGYFQILYVDGKVHGYRIKMRARAGMPLFRYSNWITKNFM